MARSPAEAAEPRERAAKRAAAREGEGKGERKGGQIDRCGQFARAENVRCDASAGRPRVRNSCLPRAAAPRHRAAHSDAAGAANASDRRREDGVRALSVLPAALALQSLPGDSGDAGGIGVLLSRRSAVQGADDGELEAASGAVQSALPGVARERERSGRGHDPSGSAGFDGACGGERNAPAALQLDFHAAAASALCRGAGVRDHRRFPADYRQLGSLLSRGGLGLDPERLAEFYSS